MKTKAKLVISNTPPAVSQRIKTEKLMVHCNIYVAMQHIDRKRALGTGEKANWDKGFEDRTKGRQ